MTLFKSKNVTLGIVWIMVFLPSILGILGSLHNVPLHINAWDEETYLSYLGARNLDWEGGSGVYWIAGKTVSLLHNFGLDGSKINAIFDFLIILISSFVMRRYCASKQINGLLAPLLTAILLYIVCVFNYANPIINNMGGFDIKSIITSGRENYSFFLRTPNPQLTILVIFIQYLLLETNHTSKKIIGLLLTPFIIVFGYIFILPGYVVMLIFMAKSWVPKIRSSYYNLIAISILLTMCVTLGYLAETYAKDPSKASFINQMVNEGRIAEMRMFRISFMSLSGVFLFLTFIGISANHKGYLKLSKSMQLPSRIAIGALVASIISTSWSIVYGFDLEPKNFIDYGSGFWGSIAFSLLLLDVYKLRTSGTKIFIFFFALLACILSTFFYGKKAVINYSYSQRASWHKPETLSIHSLTQSCFRKL